MSRAVWEGSHRITGLRRFAVAISVLNVLGHTWFGFEQAWAQPLVALVVAYGLELSLEGLDAALCRRPPRFAGGPRRLVDFLLSAHITGLAVAMLLYANDRLGPIVFATAVAVGSKAVLRAGGRHVMNPSNIGITATLLCFPWVGIAPPYHFTENLDRVGDWLLPAVIVVSGTMLNARFTRRLPLVATWLAGFAGQAALRSAVAGTPLVASLSPMSGLAFLLYTFYMVTDPATTPASRRGQIAFGLAVAATYGALMALHVVFGLFFALSIVCLGRGAGLWVLAAWRARSSVPTVGVPAPALADTRLNG